MKTLARLLSLWLVFSHAATPARASETRGSEYYTFALRAKDKVWGDKDKTSRRQPQGIVQVFYPQSQRSYFYFCNDFNRPLVTSSGRIIIRDLDIGADVSRCEMLGERENGYSIEEMKRFSDHMNRSAKTMRWGVPILQILTAGAIFLFFKRAKFGSQSSAVTAGASAIIPFAALDGLFDVVEWHNLAQSAEVRSADGNYVAYLGSDVDIVELADALEQQLWAFDHCKITKEYGFICRDDWNKPYTWDEIRSLGILR